MRPIVVQAWEEKRRGEVRYAGVLMGTVVIMMLVAGSVQHAHGQESAAVQCIALLRDAIVNRTIRQESLSSADTALAEACSQLQQASTSAGSGKVFLKFLGIELGRSESESMQQLLCTRDWSESTLQTSLYVATSFLDPQASQIVESCLSLSAIGLEDETLLSSDRSQLTITLKTRNLLPGTMLMVTGFQVTGASCSGPLMTKMAMRSDGRTRRVMLSESAIGLTCQRSGNESATLILYTNAGSIMRELPALPQPLDPMSAEALGARIAELEARANEFHPPTLRRMNCYWFGGEPWGNTLSAPDGYYVTAVRNEDSGHWFGDKLWIEVCQP